MGDIRALRLRFIASTLVASACVLVSCNDVEPEAGAPTAPCSEADSDPAHDVSFARDIRPILNRYETDPKGPGCGDCHVQETGDFDQKKGIEIGGLEMTTLRLLREGGKTTHAAIVIAGKPCESGIVKKIRGTYPIGARMPKESPRYLNDAEIRLFSDWIAEGAKGEDDE